MGAAEVLPDRDQRAGGGGRHARLAAGASRARRREAAKAILAAGGKVVMETSIIVGVGALMFFEDTEGNVFGAIQPDSNAE